MSGTATVFYGNLDGAPWTGSMDPFAFALEHGEAAMLPLAVLWSLFTDARAPDDLALPPGETDRRGWWRDAFELSTMFAGDALPKGSLLWTLYRANPAKATLGRVETICRDALAWMVGAGLAASVEARANRARGGALLLAVTVTRPDGAKKNFTFDNLWEAYRNARYH